MAREIAEMKAWKQSWMPPSRARSARLIIHMQHYHDELLTDLGASPLRKRGVFAPIKELIFRTSRSTTGPSSRVNGNARKRELSGCKRRAEKIGH